MLPPLKGMQVVSESFFSFHSSLVSDLPTLLAAGHTQLSFLLGNFQLKFSVEGEFVWCLPAELF